MLHTRISELFNVINSHQKCHHQTPLKCHHKKNVITRPPTVAEICYGTHVPDPRVYVVKKV